MATDPNDSNGMSYVVNPKPIGPTDSVTGAGLSNAEQRQIAQIVMAILSDPTVLQSLQGQGGQSSSPSRGMVESPMNQVGLWGAAPNPGPLQWLGGMPPGYNDDVAKQLSKAALAGNVMSGGVGKALGSAVSGLFGGGQRGQLAGGLAQILPWLVMATKG